MLNIIAKNLNTIHNKELSNKSWEILIGRWLSTWIKHIPSMDYKIKSKKYIIKKLITLKLIPII